MPYIRKRFHKESTHVTVLNETGKLIERMRILTWHEQFVRLFPKRPKRAKATLDMP